MVQEEIFLGLVGREKLRLALGSSRLFLPPLPSLTTSTEQLLSERSPTELAQECTFINTYAMSEPDLIDLSSLMEVSVLELRTEVPLELVVNTIQKMVRVSDPFHPPAAEKDVQLFTELAANSFHATGETYGSDHEVRYCRFIDRPPTA